MTVTSRWKPGLADDAHRHRVELAAPTQTALKRRRVCRVSVEANVSTLTNVMLSTNLVSSLGQILKVAQARDVAQDGDVAQADVCSKALGK